MLLEYEVAHCSRTCLASGRTLAPGEAYFSTLLLEQGRLNRRDYAASAWQGPPEDAIAWWRSRVPDGDAAKPKLAPQDVLVNLFSELADQPAEADFRYVLGLLLIRRRILKIIESHGDATGEILILECPRREERFELRAVVPTDADESQLEQRLVDLLYGGE